MSIGSIGSQASIANLNELSGVNSTQGVFGNHTITQGNSPITNNSSNFYEFPTTSLASRQASIPH